MYAQSITEQADYLRGEYDRLRSSPEASSAQDATMVTTEGVGMSAELMRDAAKRARDTLSALTELQEDENYVV